MERSNSKGITSLRNLILLLILAPVFALASSFTDSVLIGGSGPADSKAQLDVKSTTKGVLLPRMTTTQQNAITSPTEGLILYDNVLHQLSVYDGVAWQAMFDAGNLTGTVPAGSVPAATTGATGVVFAKNATTHNFVTGITSGTGAITTAQPAFTDISGSVAASQLPNPSSSSLGGVQSAASVSHQWINSISTLGVPSLSQPAFSDISGTASLTTQVTGTLPIANGGTGQTAKQGAFDALSPLTSAGDMLVFASGHNDRVGTVLADVGKAWTSGGGTVPNGWSVLGVAGGGTGFSAYTTGDVLYASGSSALSKLGIGTTGQVLKVSGGVPVWGTASGGTGVNFIVNPDAETDASTWNLYGVAGQNPPGDGSTSVGGPVQSFARTTSTPLTGTGSFLLTHPASNAQGYGVSTDFTIDNASQAKVMNIEFDYQVASGTFAAGSPTTDSDVEIWVYDITNAKLIQPTTYKLSSNSTSPPSHFLANFQTASNSTSYRLIFHFATTATSAFTLKFDTVSVAPSKYTYGTPITDWVSYTPTFVGWTASAINVFSRRVGENLEVRGSFSTASATGSTASMTLGYNGVNGGVSVNTSKITVPTVVGFSSNNGASTTYFGGAVVATVATPTVINFGVQTSTLSNENPAIGTNVVLGGATQVQFFFSVPVAGWSSTIQMSDSAPQTAVSAAAHMSSTQSITSTQSVVNFDTVDFDTVGGVTTGAGWIYTAKTPGYYEISVFAVGSSTTFAVANATNWFLYKNGSQYEAMGTFVAQTTSAITPRVSGFGGLFLNAGETVSVKANSDSTTTFQSGAWIYIRRSGDSRTIGATETVSAMYHLAGTQSFTTSVAAVLKPDTKDWDTHSAFSTSTGFFTLPYSGKYRACAFTNLTGATAGTGELILNQNIAGTGGLRTARTGISSTNAGVNACYEYNGIAGAQIGFELFQSNGATRTNESGQMFETFDRIGN